jgi:hypothetical protein
MIFPEGTRMPAGQTRRYGVSGAALAAAAGRRIVPVAHDAGHYWPRRGWRKKRGTVTFVIGEPVDAAGRDPRDVNREIQDWIEDTIRNIDEIAETAAACERRTPARPQDTADPGHDDNDGEAGEPGGQETDERDRTPPRQHQSGESGSRQAEPVGEKREGSLRPSQAAGEEEQSGDGGPPGSRRR